MRSFPASAGARLPGTGRSGPHAPLQGMVALRLIASPEGRLTRGLLEGQRRLARRLDTASSFGGVLGGMLLLLSVAALFLGVLGAFYLDRSGASHPAQLAQQPVAETPEAPAAPAPAPPAPKIESPPEDSEPIPPETVRALDGIQPTAGPATPTTQGEPAPSVAAAPAAVIPAGAPPQIAAPTEPGALASPAEESNRAGPGLAAPAGAAEAAPAPALFRVEYATYGAGHRTYADRLAGALAAIGIDAMVGTAHDPAGRPLITVWSPAADRTAAMRTASDARRQLHLHPAVRRQIDAARLKGPAQGSHPAPAVERFGRLRVQAAAFDRQPAAKRLQRRLAAEGITTTVSARHRPSGRPIFLVLTIDLPDRPAARAMAARVQRVIGTPPLVIARRDHSPEPAQTTLH